MLIKNSQLSKSTEPSTAVHLSLNSRCENLGDTKTRPAETHRLAPQSKIRSAVPASSASRRLLKYKVASRNICGEMGVNFRTRSRPLACLDHHKLHQPILFMTFQISTK
jgi:hypothetical protein